MILLLGSNGLLGSAISRHLDSTNLIAFSNKPTLVAPSRFFDLSENPNQLKIDLDTITVVIISAALSNVGFCERHKELSKKINLEKPIEYTKYFNDMNIPCILFSSEYVFDGLVDTCYTESSILSPKTYYGEHKAGLEEYFKDDYYNLIFRIGKLMSVTDNRSFLAKMVDELDKNNPYLAAVDQVFSPIPLELAVRIILELVKKKKNGLFNLCSRISTSRYQLGLTLINRFKCPGRVTPIKLSDLETNYYIPRNLCMSSKKLFTHTDCSEPFNLENLCELSGFIY